MPVSIGPGLTGPTVGMIPVDQDQCRKTVSRAYTQMIFIPVASGVWWPHSQRSVETPPSVRSTGHGVGHPAGRHGDHTGLYSSIHVHMLVQFAVGLVHGGRNEPVLQRCWRL
jgi:hypothetical protein